MNPSPASADTTPGTAPGPDQMPAQPPAPVLDWSDETGAQTAEYGIVTLAAVGFAGVLAVVLAGADVQGLLLDIVKNALSFG
ncbi:MAG: hypothetical protein MOP51_514 [Citricoccus sp.]|nr:hypothetical protein [Citricoccus sp. WCRC_4]